MEKPDRQEEDDPAWMEYLEKQENDWERQAKLWAQREAKENWLLCTRVKEPGKKIRIFRNYQTDIVRYVLLPCLVEKFRKFGFKFTQMSREITIYDRENNIHTYIDASLGSGDKEMIIEVESEPTTDDIKDHIERMEKIRTHASRYSFRRIHLGAIMGVAISDTVKTFALENGFYVIEPSGEEFAITVPEGEYSLREW
jgi:hypothetical protein